ncbi:3-deoxy-D-manno-octulosonic acid transferase [Flavobacterium ardleyense]|uniref:3-deoxy-D-manno-octulosonic acid transferase n=1 Tax=Flavobacterium ardleyense TaxID=2038737 RepID=UPI00298C8FA4|nr:glycosyltransferase N-terminal domain-containing protein [Flavobacterium ardleyense]
MFFLYNILIFLSAKVVKLLSLFNPKMALFVDGRKDVFDVLKRSILTTDKTIWFHAASLGEYEQGLPVMEMVKQKYPNHKIVLTFFSPSGYEVRKNNTMADVTVYLPLDTSRNAERFMNLVNPEIAFIIKYEYWPNYLKELRKRKIRTFLISGIFRENQVFFKWYGGFYREALKTFERFFVQNEKSQKLLETLNYSNVTVSGDTRFDRVAEILERDNQLDFVSNFKGDSHLIVVGSSWPKDEENLLDFINSAPAFAKFIIAPHNIKEEQILAFAEKIQVLTILYSKKGTEDLSTFKVLIVDTVGLLTKIYSYADIAYVGGGFGNPGIHNILEPATFGIPIVVGPNYSHFAEAVEIIKIDAAISVKNATELHSALRKLLSSPLLQSEYGSKASQFVQKHKGATETILNYLQNDNI